MEKQSHRIDELLIKYRENQCSQEEYEELVLLAQNEDNAHLIKELMVKDWKGHESQVQSETEVAPNRDNWGVPLKVAAAIAVLVVGGFVLFQWFTPDPIAYATGNGEVMEITLPDGSEVTLNANSNLTWMPAENMSDDRLVELTGEAFFEVVKESVPKGDSYRGFQVRTPNMTVHVLGTSFNIAARMENTEVYLEEGSVELQLPEYEDETRKMIPGDKVILDNQTGIVTEQKSKELATSASWVTGILNYHDKSVEDVLQNLSDLFGVQIDCEDSKLKVKQINLGVPYMDWENTRRALEMAIEVEFRKEGKRYKVVQTNKTNK